MWSFHGNINGNRRLKQKYDTNSVVYFKKSELDNVINDIVCDTIDKLIDEDKVTCHESIDVAYIVADNIKNMFFMRRS